LIAYAVVVLFGSLAFYRQEQSINRVDRVVEQALAERCVNEWRTVTEVRNAIPIPIEALIEVLGSEPDSEDEVAAIRDSIDRRIRDAYPDPKCDLREAQASLE
jgi:hypothetical protein